MVERLIPSDRTPGGVLTVAKGAPRTLRAMSHGRAAESDEHLVVNECESRTKLRGQREQWSRRSQGYCNAFPQAERD